MDVILWVLAIYLAFMAGLAVMALLMVRQLKRRNRVSPQVKSDAPVTWLVSPKTTARLHRRLQVAVRATQIARTPGVQEAHPTLPELALTLEQEAIVMDQYLVGAARTPRRHRRHALRPLHAQVREIERLATEVAASARRAGPQALPAASTGLEDVAQQLQQLREAQAEVERIEAIERGEMPVEMRAELPRPSAT